MGTYAYVGAHTIERQGKIVVWLPWEACLSYHDTVLMHTLAMRSRIPSEQALLRWLRRRDELIRSDFAVNINEGMSGQDGFDSASAKHKHLWEMEDDSKAAPLVAETLSVEEVYDRGQKRQRGGDGSGAANHTPADH